MFKYASTKGMANRKGVRVLLPSNFLLLKAFNLRDTVVNHEAYNSLIIENKNFVRQEEVSNKFFSTMLLHKECFCLQFVVFLIFLCSCWIC